MSGTKDATDSHHRACESVASYIELFLVDDLILAAVHQGLAIFFHPRPLVAGAWRGTWSAFIQDWKHTLFVYQSQYAGTNKATSVVGDDVKSTVQALKAKGVTFEKYDSKG